MNNVKASEKHRLDGYEDIVRNKIHRIGGIGSMDTSFVFGTIKKSGVFPEL